MQFKAAVCDAKRWHDGMLITDFLFRGCIPKNINFSIQKDHSFMFVLITEVTEFEAFWLVEGNCQENYLEYTKINLLWSTADIYGNIVMNGVGPEKIYFSNFFGSQPSFEKSFKITDNQAIEIKMFIFLNTKTNEESSQRELFDIVFYVKDEAIPANSQKLSAQNVVFAQMLTRETLQQSAGRIRINDMEPSIFKIILKFITHGTLDVRHTESPDVIREILVAAQKFSINNLLEVIQACQPDLATQMGHLRVAD